ncbi:amino acid transporter [Thioclava sp. SK-1]|uniref:LysE/ArgO family amino acid transporter n=1 Tax=Thioclava sp. SK-1 TaxID=1889770 RepID=UPI00082670BE|nr:LysE/ArgO family amino acid transporter [Thioclava sp. SK-1]OCX67189.1 amino acid transporter [Thioclava sp. SK-1]
MTAFAAGFAGFRLGLGLILAIGAQNAFVLRQGLRREHVFAVALFCALSDAILICLGIGGFAIAREALPLIVPILRWGGVAFLLVYAMRAAWSAWRGGAGLIAGEGASPSLRSVLTTVALFTWANPHVYLDTVVFMGMVSSQFHGVVWAFGMGAVTASFVFFFALAYGARLLAPLFAKPFAWRVLDGFVALVLLSVAVKLALGPI